MAGWRNRVPIALIEAKDNTHAVGDGMQQGLDYAETLKIPFVFSSNGGGFVFHDRTGASAEKETTIDLDAFPSPGGCDMVRDGPAGYGDNETISYDGYDCLASRHEDEAIVMLASS